MVTVWGTFQLVVVKVSVMVGCEVVGELPPRSNPSVVSVEVTGIVTVAVGARLSLTVKVSVVPASLVAAVVLLTVKPGTSLSTFVTVIICAPLQLLVVKVR